MGRSDRDGSEAFVLVGQEDRGLVGERRGLKSWSGEVRHDWYMGVVQWWTGLMGMVQGHLCWLVRRIGKLSMKRGLMGWSERGKRKGRVKSAFWHVPEECV